MGVVRRQGFKYTIVNFIGVGIGVVSTLFIYPRALEIVGLFRALFDAAVLATILVLLGSPTAAIRFFPRYRDAETSHKGFLTWLLMIYAGGFLLFLLFFPLVNQFMVRYIFNERNKLFEDFVIYLIPLTFCIGLLNLLSRYISNFSRIVIPNAFESLTIKITLPLIIFMYIYGWLNVEGVVLLIVVSYILATIGTTAYLYKLGQYRLTKPLILSDKSAIKEYARFSLFSLLTGISNQISFRIDGLMVAGMIHFTASGLYAISWAISDVVSKPGRAIQYITGPLVAGHLEHGRMEDVKILYKKSALNMTIISLGLFLLIWAVLPYIFSIMPNTEEMRAGTNIVFFLSLAMMWDMVSGINGEIIQYSRYYKFNLYFTLFLGIINVLANLYFIRNYGMTGAAMATCLSLFIFNMAKMIFIWITFGFQPFSVRFIPVIGFGIGAWFVTRWLPDTGSSWIDLFYKSLVFCLLYGFIIWRFKFSEDINDWMVKALASVKEFMRKKLAFR